MFLEFLCRWLLALFCVQKKTQPLALQKLLLAHDDSNRTSVGALDRIVGKSAPFHKILLDL